jgi:hypothetical protein
MPAFITAKIDVTKIDKSRFFQGKNGAKYLDLVLIPSPNDRYGNTHFITQSTTKEERDQGVKLPILGNAKEQAPRGEGVQQDAPAERTPPPRSLPARSTKPVPSPDDDGDVPF